MPPPADLIIAKTRRADMPGQVPKEGKLKGINIEFDDKGGGTVTCIHDSPGDMPFGGKPKVYAFESPESINRFVSEKIAGGGAPAGDAVPPGQPGPPTMDREPRMVGPTPEPNTPMPLPPNGASDASDEDDDEY